MLVQNGSRLVELADLGVLEIFSNSSILYQIASVSTWAYVLDTICHSGDIPVGLVCLCFEPHAHPRAAALDHLHGLDNASATVSAMRRYSCKVTTPESVEFSKESVWSTRFCHSARTLDLKANDKKRHNVCYKYPLTGTFS
jgi:hypothetical protein